MKNQNRLQSKEGKWGRQGKPDLLFVQRNSSNVLWSSLSSKSFAVFFCSQYCCSTFGWDVFSKALARR